MVGLKLNHVSKRGHRSVAAMVCPEYSCLSIRRVNSLRLDEMSISQKQNFEEHLTSKIAHFNFFIPVDDPASIDSRTYWWLSARLLTHWSCCSLALNHQYASIIVILWWCFPEGISGPDRKCHCGGHYWDYYPGALSFFKSSNPFDDSASKCVPNP